MRVLWLKVFQHRNGVDLFFADYFKSFLEIKADSTVPSVYESVSCNEVIVILSCLGFNLFDDNGPNSLFPETLFHGKKIKF